MHVSSPSIPNTPQPSSSSTCPVCGTSVLQKSAFCPRCGNPLGSATQSRGSASTNNASAVSEDQTMLVKPSQQPMNANIPSHLGYPSSQVGVQVASSVGTSAATYPGQNNTFNGQVQQGMRRNGSNAQSSPSGFTLPPRMIILLLIVLALLIAFLLILTHR